jgi:hypothetical protein
LELNVSCGNIGEIKKFYLGDLMAKKNEYLPRELKLEREERIWKRRCQFWAVNRIAAEENLSSSVVTKILYKIFMERHRRLQDDVERVRLEKIHQLEYIADEAMQAWERSKTQFIREKEVESSDGLGRPSSQTTKEIHQLIGDPRYLLTAIKAQEGIRKILGIEAPQVIKHSNDNKAPLTMITNVTTDAIEASRIYQKIMQESSI